MDTENALPTGAQWITRFLEARGVRRVAGIPGGAVLPLYRALADAGIDHVLTRHEQGAAFVAQGMARVSGRAAVCIATSGPGLTNLLTALADAHADSVPLVAIVGQVPLALRGTNAFQEVDTTALVESISKSCIAIRDAAGLPEWMHEAFRIAESGRPGPVVIELPKDLQTAPVPNIDTSPRTPATPAVSLDGELLNQAATMIDRARQPLLYLGGGCRGAYEHARQLAERSDIPVATTLMALGALPHGHPLALGMLGQHGARSTNHAINECDLLIAVGARFDDRVTGRADTFAPRARVIHIDIDPREHGKIRRPELALEADAGEVLAGLAARATIVERNSWRARIETLRAQDRTHPAAPAGQLAPQDLIRACAAALGPDTIVTTDVGQHQMWVAQHYPFARPDRWFTSSGLGTMGFGLPAAIGAALAEPDSRVLCVSGDGSLLMNAQELATLAERGLDVKIVVMDNGGLGLVRQQQALFYEQRYSASGYARTTDLCALARAYGVTAIDLDGEAEPEAALVKALTARGPVLVRAPIDPDARVLPMVPAGASNTEPVDYDAVSELVESC